MKEFEPAQILGQRYQLVRVIASGTFGIVWQGEHLALRSPVAVKVLDPLSLQGEARQRFLTEALAAAALRSPHVVQILDCGVEGDTPYIVMELLEGESLAERLARVSRLGVVETARVVRHIARAIDRAHEAGIVHRDLKPANVFIQENDGDEIVKVLDFGIARTLHGNSAASPSVTPPGVILGTPQYMSPEQASGALAVDFRSDIWSLGVIAYECLVGKPPHDGATIYEVLAAILSATHVVPSEHADVPDGFDAWFARACAHDASARFESGKRAADEFVAMCRVARSAAARSDAFSAPSRSPHAPQGSSPASSASRGMAAAVRAQATPRRLAPAAALAVALVGAGWFVLDGSFEGVSAMPQVDSSPTVTSERLQVSPALASPAALGLNEPRSGASGEPSPGAGTAPSVPQPPSRAAAGARTPAPRQPHAKRARNKPARDCREPWFYDAQGLPRAKRECL